MRVLYVSTEIHPALKTGGLADVNAALPAAMNALGADVRMLVPAFPAIAAAARGRARVAEFATPFGNLTAGIDTATLNGVSAYLIDAPEFYARDGNPYVDALGRDWPDNHLRFALLGWTAARFADGSIGGWRPDVIHGHDWHAGLAPAYLAAHGGERPASVFTVHNLAYQGQFPAQQFAALQLPSRFFAMHGLEFHGAVNFMKAGLHYADRITTVSPSYAREIQTIEHGCGMEGLLRSRSAALTGILNGVDRAHWDPQSDRHIAARYDARNLSGKTACRKSLRAELGLAQKAKSPLFCVVSRLTAQKGLDLLLPVVPALVAQGGQLAVLGAGDAALEQAFREAAALYAGAISVRVGYDEALAHRIFAGADVILVPSRFEPCGLTQLYGLAYGTLPLARAVGGLRDTVHDADAAALAAGRANGFLFSEASSSALEAALRRAFELWRAPPKWRGAMRSAMRENFGWEAVAQRYLRLYRELRPTA